MPLAASRDAGPRNGDPNGASSTATADARSRGHLDRQAMELALDIAGAFVQRVADGIQIIFASGMLYDFDSDAIRVEAAENLRALAASLKKYPDTELRIVGHTDARGDTGYNLDLSRRRALAAAQQLVMQGIAPARIIAVGKGAAEAVAPNDTDAGRQRNRRVELYIHYGARQP